MPRIVENLTINNILALALYTSNSLFSKILNDRILGIYNIPNIPNIQNIEANNIVDPYIKYLHDILESLPCFTNNEIFIGTAKPINRSNFLVGTEFSYKTFNSASALWSVAVANCKSFQKDKLGTIFIIKPKTARYICQYSEFSGDSEVIIMPNSKFKVIAWYTGDVIALGQSNIRQKTFGINQDNIERMIHSNNALIIELEEI